MDKRTSDTRGKNTASNSTSHYRRIAIKDGRKGTKATRTKFSDGVIGTDDKIRITEAGSAINIANAAKCAWNIADGNKSTEGSANEGRDYEEV